MNPFPPPVTPEIKPQVPIEPTFDEQLQDLALESNWNGYLIVENDKLTRANWFESVYENFKSYFGLDNKVDAVQDKVITFIEKNATEIKNEEQLTAINKITHKVWEHHPTEAKKLVFESRKHDLEDLVNTIAQKITSKIRMDKLLLMDAQVQEKQKITKDVSHITDEEGFDAFKNLTGTLFQEKITTTLPSEQGPQIKDVGKQEIETKEETKESKGIIEKDLEDLGEVIEKRETISEKKIETTEEPIIFTPAEKPPTTEIPKPEEKISEEIEIKKEEIPEREETREIEPSIVKTTEESKPEISETQVRRGLEESAIISSEVLESKPSALTTPDVTQRKAKTANTAQSTYEEMMKASFNVETSNSYHEAIHTIFKTIEDSKKILGEINNLEGEQKEVWLGKFRDHITHLFDNFTNKENKFILIAQAHQLAKNINAPQEIITLLEQKFVEHIRETNPPEKPEEKLIEGQESALALAGSFATSEDDEIIKQLNSSNMSASLDRLKFDIDQEPLGTSLSFFEKATGSVFNEDRADEADKVVYDIFTTIETLKDFEAPIERPGIMDTLFTLARSPREGLSKVKQGAYSYLENIEKQREQELLFEELDEKLNYLTAGNFQNSMVVIESARKMAQKLQTELLPDIFEKINRKLSQTEETLKNNNPEGVYNPTIPYDADLNVNLNKRIESDEEKAETRRKLIKTGLEIAIFAAPFMTGQEHLQRRQLWEGIEIDLQPQSPQMPLGISDRSEWDLTQSPQRPLGISDKPEWDTTQSPQRPLGISDRPEWDTTQSPQRPLGISDRPEWDTTQSPQRPIGISDKPHWDLRQSPAQHTLSISGPPTPIQTHTITPINLDIAQVGMSQADAALGIAAFATGAIAKLGIVSKVKDYLYSWTFEGRARLVIETAIKSIEKSPKTAVDLATLPPDERQFIEFSRDNLGSTFEVLKKMHQEKPFRQDQIDNLFSHLLLTELNGKKDVDAIRERLNEDTPFNEMIYNAVKEACAGRIGAALFKIRGKTNENSIESVMSGGFIPNDNRGLRAYTNISPELVLEQINEAEGEYGKTQDNNDSRQLLGAAQALHKAVENMSTRELVSEPKVIEKPTETPVKRTVGDARIRTVIEEGAKEDSPYSTEFESTLIKETEVNFIRAAKNNLENVLNTLEALHNEHPFTQKEIFELITPNLTRELTNPMDIAALRSRLNRDTPLNAMILKTVMDDCADDVNMRVYLLKSQKIRADSPETVKQTAFEAAMGGNPYGGMTFTSTEGKEVYGENGLNKYTKLSYDLVLEQIGKSVKLNENGNPSTAEADYPATFLYTEVFKEGSRLTQITGQKFEEVKEKEPVGFGVPLEDVKTVGTTEFKPLNLSGFTRTEVPLQINIGHLLKIESPIGKEIDAAQEKANQEESIDRRASLIRNLMAANPKSAMITLNKMFQTGQPNDLTMAKQLLTEALETKPLAEILPLIIPNVVSTNTIKEVLINTINSKIKDKAASETLLNYIKNEVAKPTLLDQQLGMELMQEFASVHANDPDWEKPLLEYGVQLEKTNTPLGDYLSVSIGNAIIKDKKDIVPTLKKYLKPNDWDQAILIAKSAVVTRPESVEFLIAEIGRLPQNNRPSFSPILEHAARFNRELLEDLNDEFKKRRLNQSNPYQSLFVQAEALLKKEGQTEPIVLPKSFQFVSVIANALDASKPTEETKQSFIEMAHGDMNTMFGTLEQLQNEKSFDQAQISTLISKDFIRSLQLNELNLVRSHLNFESPLNRMITQSVKDHCSDDVEAALSQMKHLEENPKQEKRFIEYQTLSSVMTGPEFENYERVSLEDRQKMGIQVYTRLSHDIVLEQVEKHLRFDPDGNVSHAKGDYPAALLHEEISRDFVTTNKPEDIRSFIQEATSRSRASEETTRSIRTQLLKSSPETVRTLPGHFITQLLDTGVPKQAQRTEQELDKILSSDAFNTLGNTKEERISTFAKESVQQLQDSGLDSYAVVQLAEKLEKALPDSQITQEIHSEACKIDLQQDRESVIKQINQTLSEGKYFSEAMHPEHKATLDVYIKELIDKDINNLIDIAQGYLVVMSKGATPQANAAEASFKTILKNIQTNKSYNEAVNVYKEVAKQALVLGGIKGRQLAENLFELCLSYEVEDAFEIFDSYSASPGAQAREVQKMADLLAESPFTNDDGLKSIANSISSFIETAVKNKVRSAYLAPLIDWAIQYQPAMAQSLILKDLKLDSPYLKDHLEDLMEGLRKKDHTLAVAFLTPLFNHKETKIKAMGSTLFYQLMMKNDFKLPVTYPKAAPEVTLKLLNQLLSHEDPFIAEQIKPRLSHLIPALEVDIEVKTELEKEKIEKEQKLELKAQAQHVALPDVNIDDYKASISSEAEDYLFPKTEAEANLAPPEFVKDLSKNYADLQSEIQSNPMLALKNIDAMLRDPSLRVSTAGRHLVLELIDKLANDKTRLRDLLAFTNALPSSMADLKQEIAARLAKANSINSKALEEVYQNLVVNKRTKDVDAAVLFYKGLASVDFQKTKPYLLDLRFHNIPLKDIFTVLRDVFPDDASTLAGEWKNSKNKDLHELADNLTPKEGAISKQPFSIPEQVLLTELMEGVLQGNIGGPTLQGNVSELMGRNLKTFILTLKTLLTEITDADEAVKTGAIFLEPLINQMQKPEILKIIKQELSVPTFFSDIMGQVLDKKIAQDMAIASQDVIEGRPQIADNQSRIQRIVAPALKTLQFYSNNFPYRLLKAMDNDPGIQKLRQNNIDYLSMAVSNELIGRKDGAATVYSLLAHAIRDEYFDRNPPNERYETLRTFRDALLEKHPELFPNLALNYLNQMDGDSVERAIEARKELNELVAKNNLKPFSFKIAHAAVIGGEHISNTTQKFIIDQLNNYIKSGQVSLALEVFKNYAYLTPQLANLQQTLDQLDKLPLTKAQRTELVNTVYDIIKQDLDREISEFAMLPAMEWLINADHKKAFKLLSEEFLLNQPGFQETLPTLILHLTKKDPLISRPLFLTLASHPNEQVRAAASVLANTIAAPLPGFLDPTITKKGMLANQFEFQETSLANLEFMIQNREKYVRDDADLLIELDLQLAPMEEEIKQLEVAKKEIPILEKEFDELNEFLNFMDEFPADENDLEAVLSEANTTLEYRAKIKKTISKLENHELTVNLYADQNGNYSEIGRYNNLKAHKQTVENEYNTNFAELQSLKDEFHKTQEKQAVIIDLANRLKSDIPMPVIPKAKAEAKSDAFGVQIPSDFSDREYEYFDKTVNSMTASNLDDLSSLYQDVANEIGDDPNGLRFLASIYAKEVELGVPPEFRKTQIGDLLLDLNLQQLNTALENNKYDQKLIDLITLGLEDLDTRGNLTFLRFRQQIANMITNLEIPAKTLQNDYLYSSFKLKKFITQNKTELSNSINNKTEDNVVVELNNHIQSILPFLSSTREAKIILTSIYDAGNKEIKDYIADALNLSVTDSQMDFKILMQSDKNIFENSLKSGLKKTEDVISHQASIQNVKEIQRARPTRRGITRPTDFTSKPEVMSLEVPQELNDDNLNRLVRQIRAQTSSTAYSIEEKYKKSIDIYNTLNNRLGENDNALGTLAELINIIDNNAERNTVLENNWNLTKPQLLLKTFTTLNNLSNNNIRTYIEKNINKEPVLKFLGNCAQYLPESENRAFFNLLGETKTDIALSNQFTIIKGYVDNTNKLSQFYSSQLYSQTTHLLELIEESKRIKEFITLVDLQDQFKNVSNKKVWAEALLKYFDTQRLNDFMNTYSTTVETTEFIKKFKVLLEFCSKDVVNNQTTLLADEAKDLIRHLNLLESKTSPKPTIDRIKLTNDLNSAKNATDLIETLKMQHIITDNVAKRELSEDLINYLTPEKLYELAPDNSSGLKENMDFSTFLSEYKNLLITASQDTTQLAEEAKKRIKYINSPTLESKKTAVQKSTPDNIISTQPTTPDTTTIDTSTSGPQITTTGPQITSTSAAQTTSTVGLPTTPVINVQNMINQLKTVDNLKDLNVFFDQQFVLDEDTKKEWAKELINYLDNDKVLAISQLPKDNDLQRSTFIENLKQLLIYGSGQINDEDVKDQARRLLRYVNLNIK